MRKYLPVALGFVIASLLVGGLAFLEIPLAAHATTVTPIFGGGTGTSTAPGNGKVLIGDASGNYELVSTSSLNISSGNSGNSFGYPFSILTNFGQSTSATTSPLWAGGGVFASSTVSLPNQIDNYNSANGTTTNATSTNDYVSGLFKNGSGSGLALETSGIFSAYTGTNPCSASQALLSLNASGVGSCTNVAAFAYPFPAAATSTLLTFTGGVIVNAATSTITNLVTGNASSTNATSTNAYVSGQLKNGSSSGLALETSGVFSTYGGASACSSQFVTALSAIGGTTCASINNAAWSGAQLTVANGGTGQTSFTAGQLLYGNSTAALSSVATTTITPTNGLTYSGGTGTFSAVGGTGGTLGLSSISANSVLANKTNSSAVPSAISTSTLYTPSPGISIGATLLGQIENRSFSVATSTGWTGTTTISLEVGYGEVWNSVRCFTDAGTLDVDFYHASSHLNFFNASTTKGTVGMTTNNTITSGDSVNVDIGTPASSPTTITCTVNDTI